MHFALAPLLGVHSRSPRTQKANKFSAVARPHVLHCRPSSSCFPGRTYPNHVSRAWCSLQLIPGQLRALRPVKLMPTSTGRSVGRGNTALITGSCHQTPDKGAAVSARRPPGARADGPAPGSAGPPTSPRQATHPPKWCRRTLSVFLKPEIQLLFLSAEAGDAGGSPQVVLVEGPRGQGSRPGWVSRNGPRRPDPFLNLRLPRALGDPPRPWAAARFRSEPRPCPCCPRSRPGRKHACETQPWGRTSGWDASGSPLPGSRRNRARGARRGADGCGSPSVRAGAWVGLCARACLWVRARAQLPAAGEEGCPVEQRGTLCWGDAASHICPHPQDSR